MKKLLLSLILTGFTSFVFAQRSLLVFQPAGFFLQSGGSRNQQIDGHTVKYGNILYGYDMLGDYTFISSSGISFSLTSGLLIGELESSILETSAETRVSGFAIGYHAGLGAGYTFNRQHIIQITLYPVEVAQMFSDTDSGTEIIVSEAINTRYNNVVINNNILDLASVIRYMMIFRHEGHNSGLGFNVNLGYNWFEKYKNVDNPYTTSGIMFSAGFVYGKMN
jgi:hypothetical protein